MRVILASASPRRKELLGKLFTQFEVVPAQGEEVCSGTEPDGIVQQLARQKALEVETRLFGKAGGEDYLVLGADTVVAYGGRVLGKPKDEKDAADMLSLLSGNTHQVATGVAVLKRTAGVRTEKTFCVCTDVTFYPMDRQEIADYIATGEPMDKAGSYGIQGLGGRFVERILGNYDNVVGLPVSRLYQELFHA